MTTLVEVFKALAEETRTRIPEKGELEALFRTTPEDFLTLQEALLVGTMQARVILGSRAAMDGMIQTALTIGYNMRIAHEKEDAENDADDRERM